MVTVWTYDGPDGAEQAARTLSVLAGRESLDVYASATVDWRQGRDRPSTHYAESVDGYALGGSFWGLLLGLIFSVPLLGAALGTATGAVTGSLIDVGIDDTFVNRVRDQVTPGTSALFLLTSEDTVEQLREVFAGQHRPDLLVATLSGAQEAALRAVFAD